MMARGVKPDGTKYRHCICWRQVAGHGEACKDMCKQPQKDACRNTQLQDAMEAQGALTDSDIWGDDEPTEQGNAMHFKRGEQHRFKIVLKDMRNQ